MFAVSRKGERPIEMRPEPADRSSESFVVLTGSLCCLSSMGELAPEGES